MIIDLISLHPASLPSLFLIEIRASRDTDLDVDTTKTD